ncbi:hypothetical protein [uncultured Flavobacterium sp.]|uniref:hypothetical protein n=1 Tax=uncultured Flavobacterium sp. TaxID=165435 RepID=UPI0025ECCA9A|nr:hypothetical protein [uncultured Flavobacterium sp.]
MDSINIAEEDFDRLLLFTALESDVKEKILKELSAYKKGLMPTEFVEHLIRVSNLDQDAAQDVFSLVVNLITIKDSYNIDSERLYSGVAEYFSSIGEISEELKQSVLKDLHDIIFNTSPDILFSLAALGAISDNSRQISNTRITHEIKPVFLRTGLEGFVMVHSLRIDYRENNQDKELYFSMDTSEFEALKSAIKYAESTLKQIQEKPGFDF